MLFRSSKPLCFLPLCSSFLICCTSAAHQADHDKEQSGGNQHWNRPPELASLRQRRLCRCSRFVRRGRCCGSRFVRNFLIVAICHHKSDTLPCDLHGIALQLFLHNGPRIAIIQSRPGVPPVVCRVQGYGIIYLAVTKKLNNYLFGTIFFMSIIGPDLQNLSVDGMVIWVIRDLG